MGSGGFEPATQITQRLFVQRLRSPHRGQSKPIEHGHGIGAAHREPERGLEGAHREVGTRGSACDRHRESRIGACLEDPAHQRRGRVDVGAEDRHPIRLQPGQFVESRTHAIVGDLDLPRQAMSRMDLERCIARIRHRQLAPG